MRRAFAVGWVVAAAALAGVFARADDPPAKSGGEVVVTDVDGKEHRLAAARLTTGTRRLAWKADPKGTGPDAKLGPQAVELREPNSTTFAKGVVTLIPAANLESAKYDYEKQVVTLTVKGVKEPLTGTLEYKGINVLGLSGTADGKAESFTAGVHGKTGMTVKSISFPAAAAVPPVAKEAAARGWAVKIAHPKANDPVLVVHNLKVLVQQPGGVETLLAGVPVRKGPPLPFDANLKRFELLANDPNTNVAAAEVEVGAGPEKVIAIPLSDPDKKTGTVVGFVGEVDAGYKLFPLHTVRTITPYEKKVD